MQKRGYHFSFKIFCLTVPENFAGEHFGVSENFVYRIFLCIREKGYRVSPSKTFCHTVPKNFVGEHFGVSENFGYRKYIWISEGGITFSVKNFLSHSTEKFRCGTLRCFRKFRVSQNFMHQRGGYHVSPSKIFCHTVPKNFVGEHFGVSENFGYRKYICIREGGITFSVKNFLSHSTEKFRCGTLRCFRKFRVSQNFMHQRGGYHVLRQKLLVTQYRKISLWNTSVFQKISCIAKFYASERGVSRFSVENFLSHSTEKFCWGTLRCIRKFRVSKIYMHQRGGYHVLRQKLFVTQYRKISLWNTSVFQKISCIAKFYA